MPGDAELILPETQELVRNTQTTFMVIPGKWKYIAIIRGNSWHYLAPDDEGVFFIDYNTFSTGVIYLAACETEYGAYETLAVFNIK